MESVTQLGYLGLGVSHVDDWERFATHVLDLQANGRDDDGTLFWRMDEYHGRFNLHPNGNDDVAYIGWEVADKRDLHTGAEQLSAAGVEVQPGTAAEAEARLVTGLIHFHDPSGIPSETFYGPLVTFDRPFQSPRALSGFKTGEQGLGHCVIFVDDAERNIHFNRNVLGMRISDHVQIAPAPGVSLQATFLHCNPRHHSVAFVPAPNVPKRLIHFMLQTQSLDVVGATYDLCHHQEVPITMSLGRHTNDPMLSFYMKTPSGFGVEYGWGQREVDDATWQVQMHTPGSIWGHKQNAERAAG